MPKGFFATSTLLSSKPPRSSIPKCGACGLYKGCKSPKMPPSGSGRRRVLILAEAPGADEDEEGVQLIGRSGTLLSDTLKTISVKMRKDCWLTNAIICRPPDNETPSNLQVEYCLPNLTRTLAELQPDVIIPLGAVAVRALIGHIWKEDVGPIGRWVGWTIPSQQLNAWICPNWHPSYLLRVNDQMLEMYFKKYLREAFEKAEIGKPWDKIPDYKGQVRCIINHEEAAHEIDKLTAFGGPLAFDYECNRLKPDAQNALIVSCSISNGRSTIAYPWHGKAIPATQRMILSDCPKIASNMKFEDRWTKKWFGHFVKNWLVCTMNMAHVMDNRPDITSIKFQSFVRLGAESYDDHIKPLLKTGKDSPINQILQEIDLGQLLLYNGLDSLLEYKVAMIQRREMGYGRS